ncbi:hypothetical protein MRS44_015220 [Fusarium solani]|uniref:uncharacterized protein n=1 Tax=Fusarium solani TaxID=169388 RepID=UPI0032C3D9BE|nr:hypothetical protein MRS44_015220 [Fusarium solani]
MTAENNNTVYVVTGANRGIGLGLVKTLLSRPSITVVASVRNDDAATSLKSDTDSVTKGEDSSLIIVRLDFSTALAPEQIRDAFTVDHVDVLINNAAFSPPMTLAAETPADNLRAAFETNTIGPLTVFQGLWPLLQKSTAPKVINVTSSVGCITIQEGPGGAYEPGACGCCTSSGLGSDAYGRVVCQGLGLSWFSPETIEGSVEGMLQIIDEATREKYSGKFVTYKGQELPW